MLQVAEIECNRSVVNQNRKTSAGKVNPCIETPVDKIYFQLNYN